MSSDVDLCLSGAALTSKTKGKFRKDLSLVRLISTFVLGVALVTKLGQRLKHRYYEFDCLLCVVQSRIPVIKVVICKRIFQTSM